MRSRRRYQFAGKSSVIISTSETGTPVTANALESLLGAPTSARNACCELKSGSKPGNCSFEFLGGPGDKEIIRQIREQLPSGLQGVSFAGQLALIDSVRRVAEIDELVCIDSALLHYARLCGTPVDVYMGPTDPRVLLRPMEPNHDTIHYLRIACSPCIHLATEPPCNGDNICMRYAADPDSPGTRNPIWIQH